MPLTDEQRQSLVARARSLGERMADGATSAQVPQDAATVAMRLTRWRQVTTKGDHTAFECLLASRNIPQQALGALLDTARWHANMGIPDWVATVEAVIAAADSLAATESRKTDFLVPFCAVARQRLAQTMPQGMCKLSDNALNALSDSLSHGLQFLCRSALDAQPELRHPAQLTPFLLEYSVAARAMATWMDRWHHNTRELLLRLAADAQEIAQVFRGGAALGEVVRIDCGLSDPHNGGQSVVRLHFASGLRLVYKPRSVALDLAYNGLQSWLTQNGAPYPLPTPVYLARDRYAWVEQIDHRPCGSREELSQFCRAMGALLCTGYLLDATDLHDGNVIAAHVAPVIVDLETLLQPRLAEPQSAQPQDALRKAAQLAERSILRTGLLPSLKLGADGQLADVGCLGSLFAPYSTEWYAHDPAASPLSEDMGMDVARGALDPMVLADAVAEGFAQTYRFLLDKRDALLASTGPLQAFKGQPVRFLLRDTSVYVKLLAPSLSALALREGVDRSIALESLYRLLQSRPGSDALGAVVAEEIAALEGLDIPLLATTTDSLAVKLTHGETGSPLFAESAYTAMLARLRAFGDRDLDHQLNLLHGTFAARAASSCTTTGPRTFADSGPATAVAIAQALLHRAITGDDGSVTWMAPVPIPGTRSFRFDMLGLNAESGITGVAFFLAAYSRCTGDMHMASLARRAAQTVTQRLSIDTNVLHSDTIHIAGLGSVVYSLHHIGAFLGDAELGAAARRLVQRLPDTKATAASLPGNLVDVSELCLGFLAIEQNGLAAQWGHALLAHWSRLSPAAKTHATLGAPCLALCWFRLHQVIRTDPFRMACSEALQAMHQTAGQEPAQRIALHFALLGCHGSIVDAALDTGLLETQMHALQGQPAEDSDSLWNGGCSVAERLSISGHLLNRPGLQRAAQRVLDGLLRQAQQKGGCQTVPGMPRNTFFPGFAQGLCGIGYTQLRHTFNAGLPCVQLWE